MIVAVHNKSLTYMLLFPPNRSTLYELESHFSSWQYLYLVNLCLSVLILTGFPRRSWIALQETEDPWAALGSSRTMAECTPDAHPGKVIQTPKADNKDSSEVSAESAPKATVRVRPADLGLIRSLSKSDSDLLASPLGEEDGGLAGRSGSVSNCSSGQPSTERMHSFASEWDEVILRALGMGNKWEGVEDRGSGTGFQVECVNVLKRECECVRKKKKKGGR